MMMVMNNNSSTSSSSSINNKNNENNLVACSFARVVVPLHKEPVGLLWMDGKRPDGIKTLKNDKKFKEIIIRKHVN